MPERCGFLPEFAGRCVQDARPVVAPRLFSVGRGPARNKRGTTGGNRAETGAGCERKPPHDACFAFAALLLHFSCRQFVAALPVSFHLHCIVLSLSYHPRFAANCPAAAIRTGWTSFIRIRLHMQLRHTRRVVFPHRPPCDGSELSRTAVRFLRRDIAARGDRFGDLEVNIPLRSAMNRA